MVLHGITTHGNPTTLRGLDDVGAADMVMLLSSWEQYHLNFGQAENLNNLNIEVALKL